MHERDAYLATASCALRSNGTSASRPFCWAWCCNVTSTLGCRRRHRRERYALATRPCRADHSVVLRTPPLPLVGMLSTFARLPNIPPSLCSGDVHWLARGHMVNSNVGVQLTSVSRREKDNVQLQMRGGQQHIRRF
jgi:hypothetical protein